MARGKDLSDFERGFSNETTAQLANVSIGTMTEVISAFRFMEKTLVNVVKSAHVVTMMLVH